MFLPDQHNDMYVNCQFQKADGVYIIYLLDLSTLLSCWFCNHVLLNDNGHLYYKVMLSVAVSTKLDDMRTELP